MAEFFWFSDAQWARIEPLLPTDTRGMARVDDRRVLSGIVHALRNGAVVSGIERIIAEESDIYRLNELLTMHFGPHDILLNDSLIFADRLSSTEVENSVSLLEQRIKKRFPDVKRIFIEAQHSSALTAQSTD